jgi:hypothetical protein
MTSRQSAGRRRLTIVATTVATGACLLAVPATTGAAGGPNGGTGIGGGGSSATTSTTSTTSTGAGPGAGGSSGGGVGITGGGLAPTSAPPANIPPPPSKNDPGHWLSRVTITEYWPAPESWFAGRLVHAPGLPGLYPIDWLYSATGMSMQGEGIGLDGRLYHINALGDGGWITSTGVATSPASGWSAGPPFWRAGGYWRNRRGAVTFPLRSGGWSNGRGRRYVALPKVSFAAGASLPLHYWQSIAVDPGVIPLGSRVYVPALRGDGYGGWFIAQDTGGAINGRHIDVYRPPPASPTDPGTSLTGRRIYVIPAR